MSLKVPSIKNPDEMFDKLLLNLKGKKYAPVAVRVALFRQYNPDYSFAFIPVTVGESTFIRCEIMDPSGDIIAQAHKTVKWDAKGGAAKDFPLETAETGALGRALAMCGFGTLMGDLDEGTQIADAPISTEPAAKGR